MKIKAVCEYNGQGFLIYAANYPGAYVRGAEENEALAKFGGELRSFLRWSGIANPDLEQPEIEIVQRKESALAIEDADSDVLFDSERVPLALAEYEHLKLLVLKSAQDFRSLYKSIPNPDISNRSERKTFYGKVPRTPRQMYEHTNQVTAYYTAAFGLNTENIPDIYLNRMQALNELEGLTDFLSGKIYIADDSEEWTIRKVLRRFIWHDRIHAKAMYRIAKILWGVDILNPYCFID